MKEESYPEEVSRRMYKQIRLDTYLDIIIVAARISFISLINSAYFPILLSIDTRPAVNVTTELVSDVISS